MRKAQIGTMGGLIGNLGALVVLFLAPRALAQTEAPADEAAPPPSDAAPPEEGEPAVEDPPLPEEQRAAPTEQPPEPGARAVTSPSTLGSTGLGFGAYPNPAEPAAPAAPTATPPTPPPRDDHRVFAEDWWTHTRPTVEFHGNFRVRPQLFHHFGLGRIDTPTNALWPRPADDSYDDLGNGPHEAPACTPSEAQTGTETSPGSADQPCINPTQAGANMRLRVEPTIVISDNLRIRSQIDLLDNLVMGSTAMGYSNFPAATGGYAVGSSGGVYTNGVITQNAPISGINSLQDSITVKRAWAEYETPVGQARFGRMPDHFGLGLLHNAGDDIDGDYQSTVDRLAFVTGLPSLSLYAMGAWDFPYEGPTSQAFAKPGVPAYDLAQYDDVSAMNLVLFRKIDPELEKLMLAKGQLVVNGGLYLTYAFQRIANDYSGASATCSNNAAPIDCQPGQTSAGYVRRGMEVWTPDVYAEVKYKKFRFGVEAVTHQGTIQSLATVKGDNDYENPSGDQNGWRVNQWAVATELTQTLVEDRLKLGFFFGWASGDGDVESLTSDTPQLGNRSLDTFRFHPGYRVDLILNRSILGRVQGSYYLKPMAQYDFIRSVDGMRLGGRAEAIWTRAANFMQTPGHQSDLGIELNGSVYFQSKDGVLNDDPNLIGGLYTMIQYGVLFPMSGLGYKSQERQANGDPAPGLETAQTVRLFLGVAY